MAVSEKLWSVLEMGKMFLLTDDEFNNANNVEYFCRDCGQLRLFVAGASRQLKKCGNCDATQDRLITGEPKSLDVDGLKKQYAGAFE